MSSFRIIGASNFAATDLNVKKMIKPYYQEKNSTIYCGDCLEIMPELEPVDLVVTDPPYNSSYGADIQRKWRPSALKHDFGNWDHYFNPEKYITLCLSHKLKGFISFVSDSTFGATYDLLSSKFQYCKYIVWEKTNPAPSIRKTTWRQATELIIHAHNLGEINFISQKEMRNSFKTNTCHAESVDHPTQKPLKVINKLLSIAKGDTILDPFMGSGTTLVAAKELNRKAIGIEIEEKYCEIAVNRIEKAIKRDRMSFHFDRKEKRRGEIWN